jgi:hypothetical protein
MNLGKGSNDSRIFDCRFSTILVKSYKLFPVSWRLK